MGLAPVRVYLDSCLAIYLVEEHPLFAPLLENELANAREAKIVVSNLTEMECLVIPFRNENRELIGKFQNWFDQIEVFSLTKELFHLAARLRADFTSLKTPDALHIATATFHKCDEFWTNDDRLNKINPNLVKNILAG